MRIRSLVPFAGVLALVACGGEDPERGDAAAPVEAEPVLRIGSIEGDGADVFGQVAGLAVDATGRILVIDAAAPEIRVFDPRGAHLFSFGRAGAGPGELSGPCCLAFGPDSLLWVRDGGNGRYNAYRVSAASAEPVATLRMNHSDVNRWVPLTFDADGRLVDVGSRPRPEGGVPATFRFHRGVDGTVAAEVAVPDPPAGAVPVHTVPRQLPGGGVATLFLIQPFGPRHLVAHGPRGAFAEAVSSSYDVRVYSGDGVPAHTISRSDVVAPVLSEAERTRAAAALERDAARAGIAPSALPFAAPERKQLLRHLEFDSEGNLWVFLETAESAPHRADVHDPTGAFVRAVEWDAPLQTFPLVLRPDALYGVVRDSLDVQYITRLQVHQRS